MNTHGSELSLPPNGAAPHDAANGSDAPPEMTPAEGDNLSPAPPVADAPGSPAIAPVPTASAADSRSDAGDLPPGGPALQDFPVASLLPPVAPLLVPQPGLTPLEDRLHRLEAELARLRNAPVAEALGSPQPTSVVARPRGGFWEGLGNRLLAPSGPAARGPSLPAVARDLVPPGLRRGWVLWEVLTELRAMYCMFFDPRYRLSWFGRLAPVVLVGLIFSSWIWVPFHDITGVGWILVKIADVVLAYVLFKVLSYEARRYRETAPDLPPSMRL